MSSRRFCVGRYCRRDSALALEQTGRSSIGLELLQLEAEELFRDADADCSQGLDISVPTGRHVGK